MVEARRASSSAALVSLCTLAEASGMGERSAKNAFRDKIHVSGAAQYLADYLWPFFIRTHCEAGEEPSTGVGDHQASTVSVGTTYSPNYENSKCYQDVRDCIHSKTSR